MTHDFNKPPHVSNPEETTQKKRIPVYILALVGIFFIALLIYMLAGMKPSASDTSSGHSNAEAQPAIVHNSTTVKAGNEATAKDSDTAKY